MILHCQRLLLPLACAFALCAAVSRARADDQVKVQIDVTVPDGTPPAATLYLAGDQQSVGAWKVDGIRLTRSNDGHYRATLNLPRGSTLQYKINQGTWQTVEKNADGGEMDNRTLSANADKTEPITVARWANQPTSTQPTTTRPATTQPASTETGDIRHHRAFHSVLLANDRDISVYLPPDYTTSTQRYPVLYLHDGQNCFDAATSFAGEWNADETAESLIRSGTISPLIMVAVNNAGAARIDEYTPTADPARGGGRAALHARFLIEEVKPFIDRTYRTLSDRAHTGIAGSSLGGLDSLYLVRNHADVFGLCGAISPSLWWDHRALLNDLLNNTRWMNGTRIWLDIGTAEGSPGDATESVADTRVLAAALRSHHATFQYEEVQGAQHNEKAWSARFGQVLQFLFPRPG